MTIVLDIETLPAPAESELALRELYERRPGRASTFDDYLRGTSLNGNWGRILCIGVAIDDGAVEVLHADTERELLTEFWQRVEEASRFVGHNALEFDIPFLWKRSVIHTVKPSLNPTLFRDPAFTFDTMREWACLPAGRGVGNPYTGLHELAKVLGLVSSKQGIDGSQVYDYWRAGKFQEIYDYCARDVELTRTIYKRLTFVE
ncbi:ribonuclease H-like domain-containing protein [Candidatus Berkelbacteria bacterium]|nr:ribonuclease H-like domain-containing protein [Candidatus Berkelbacteria bacterium]